MALNDLAALAAPDLPAALVPARLFGAVPPAALSLSVTSADGFGAALQQAQQSQQAPVARASELVQNRPTSLRTATDGAQQASGDAVSQSRSRAASTAANSHAPTSTPKAARAASHTTDKASNSGSDKSANSKTSSSGDQAAATKGGTSKSADSKQAAGAQQAADQHAAASQQAAAAQQAATAQQATSAQQTVAAQQAAALVAAQQAGAAQSVQAAQQTTTTQATAKVPSAASQAQASTNGAATQAAALANSAQLAAAVKAATPKGSATKSQGGPATTTVTLADAAKAAVATANSSTLDLPAPPKAQGDPALQAPLGGPQGSGFPIRPTGSGPGSPGGKVLPLLPGADKGSITLVAATDGSPKAESQPQAPGANLPPVKLDDLYVTGVQNTSAGSETPPGGATNPAGVGLPGLAGNAPNANAANSAAPPQGAASLRQTLLDQFQQASPSGPTSLKLILHPEALGTVHLHVRLVDGGVTAVLKVDRPEVRDAINQQLDNLRQSFESQGIKIDKLEVNVSGDGHPQDGSGMMNFAGQQQQQQQQQAFGQADRRLASEQYAHASAGASPDADPGAITPTARPTSEALASTLDLKA